MTLPTTLLTTKLQAPPTRPRERLVPRSGLFAKLEEACAHPLTILSAPAGYGKTTLVSAFIQHHLSGHPSTQAGWLSLDSDDDDVNEFLRYFIAALKTAFPALGRVTLALLQSPQPPPPKTLLIALINELNALTPDSPIWLVLDDYHTITAPPIHEALAYLLDHVPPQLHLILITRVEPTDLPLARLRSRQQLAELHADDLRFTTEEAAQFLNRIMGLNLSTENLAVLEQRTEGWVAGLQLAALSLQGQLDPLIARPFCFTPPFWNASAPRSARR
jgi:LuxR family transcriptional regulator, maltose regulon positive regulatory protein